MIFFLSCTPELWNNFPELIKVLPVVARHFIIPSNIMAICGPSLHHSDTTKIYLSNRHSYGIKDRFPFNLCNSLQLIELIFITTNFIHSSIFPDINHTQPQFLDSLCRAASARNVSVRRLLHYPLSSPPLPHCRSTTENTLKTDSVFKRYFLFIVFVLLFFYVVLK